MHQEEVYYEIFDYKLFFVNQNFLIFTFLWIPSVLVLKNIYVNKAIVLIFDIFLLSLTI